MKTRAIILLLAAGAAGCSNNNIDTAKVRAAFAGEPQGARALVDSSMHEVEISNYSAALGPLRELGFKYKLSGGERKILADTVHKIRVKAGMGN